MANKKISAATAISTIVMSDMLPIAKSSDSTAYFITLGQALGKSGVMSLASAVVATATSISMRSVPAWLASYGGYVVIDIGTQECEVRPITTVSGNTISFTTGLTYAHAANDNVVLISDALIGVKWFGAKGDDSTNDYTSIARALTQAGIIKGDVLVPYGTYQIGTGLVLPENVSLIGESVWGSIIKATADIVMITLSTGATTGYRNAVVENMRLDGNSLASVGLSVGQAPMCSFRNLDIVSCTGTLGYGVLQDRSQNQLWDTVRVDSCEKNFYIANNAAGNTYVNLHCTNGTVSNVVLTTDATLPGYELGQATPAHLTFYGGNFEISTETASVEMLDVVNCSRSLWSGVEFSRASTSTVPVIDIGAGGNYLTFQSCRVNGNSAPSVDMVHADGFDISFDHCWFSDLSGATVLVKTNDADAWVNFNSQIPTNGTFDMAGGGYIHLHPSTKWVHLPDWELKTIVDGAITITSSRVAVYGQGGVADNLDTINGGEEGTLLYLRAGSGTVDITVRDDGNINLDGAVDFTMDTTLDKIVLLKNPSGDWDEISRSNNG